MYKSKFFLASSINFTPCTRQSHYRQKLSLLKHLGENVSQHSVRSNNIFNDWLKLRGSKEPYNFQIYRKTFGM